MQRTLTASQLCSVNSSSFCLTPFQLWPPLLNSSQTISALLNFRNSFFQQLWKLFHLHLFPPQLAQLISPLSQLISTLLNFSTLANSFQLFSPPVTEMLAHRASFYTEKHLNTASSYTEKLLHRSFYTQQAFTQAFEQRSFDTKQALTQRSFYTEQAFSQRKLLHREAFTQSTLLYTQSKLLHRETFAQRSFYTHQAFAQRNLYTEQAFSQSKLLHKSKILYTQSKLLHREAFAQRSFYTQQAFTQRSFYTEMILHRASFCTEKLLHSELLHTASFYTGEDFTQSKLFHRASFCTEKLLHREAFTQSKLLHKASPYTEKLLHREAFSHSKLLHKASFYTEKLSHKASFCTEKLLHTSYLEKPKAARTLTAFFLTSILKTHRCAGEPLSAGLNLEAGQIRVKHQMKFQFVEAKSDTWQIIKALVPHGMQARNHRVATTRRHEKHLPCKNSPGWAIQNSTAWNPPFLWKKIMLDAEAGGSHKFHRMQGKRQGIRSLCCHQRSWLLTECRQGTVQRCAQNKV